MFEYGYLKEDARKSLKRNRGAVILVSFLATLLGTAPVFLQLGDDNAISILGYTPQFITQEVWDVILMILFVLSVAALAYNLLVGKVIQVGGAGWMLRHHREEEQPVADMFSIFKRYRPVMNAMLVRELTVYLWSLLLVILGVVKSLAYSMVPYLLIDNPELPPRRALEISHQMTKGYKGDLFLLSLSFIGWRLLGILTLGVLNIVFVNPYYELTMASAYERLKEIALHSGKLSPRDFGIREPEPADDADET